MSQQAEKKKKGPLVLQRLHWKQRADTYYLRGRGLTKKAEELHILTGAHVKCQVIPIWEGGKINRYTSPGFPVHQPRAQQQGLVTTPAPSQEHAYMEPPKSPVKDLISAAAAAEQSFAAAQKKTTMSCCAICGIENQSDADQKVQGHWVQCTKQCGFWVHASCCWIYYPDSNAGHKSLKAWSKSRFYCKKHMPQP